MTVGSPHAHQVFGTQDAIHGRKRDKEQSQIPCGHRQDPVGKVGVPSLAGHDHHGCAFLWEKPMDRVFGARLAIIKALSSLPVPRPSDHTPAIDHPQGTGADPGYSLSSGLLHCQEDRGLVLFTHPVGLYLSHEPPFVFFRRIASSTAISAITRSFSCSSCFSRLYSSSETVFLLRPGRLARPCNALSFTLRWIRARSVEYNPSRRRSSPTGASPRCASRKIWYFFSGERKRRLFFPAGDNESGLLPLSATLMAYSFRVAFGWGTPVALRAPFVPT